MASSRNKPPTESACAALAPAGAQLSRYLRSGQAVVAGLSGGLDSVVLLHYLKEALPALDVTLTACHVHHGLSPNADAWQDFCESLCREWSIPLRVERVDVPVETGEGLEAAARRARHGALSRCGGDWLILAHHRGDQAETLLFNLLRGTGLRGAAAMPPCRDDRILRPFLEIPREELAAYAAAHELRWIEDESNADVRYSRNFLRHRVMPVLSERFPAAERSLTAAASRFGEALALVDELALLDLGEQDAKFPIPLATLARLNEARARNLLRYLLHASGCRIPSEERLSESLRQLIEAAPDRHPSIDLGSHTLFRRRAEVCLRPSSAAPPIPPQT